MKFKVIALAALMGLAGWQRRLTNCRMDRILSPPVRQAWMRCRTHATLAIEVNVAAKDAATAKKQADERVAQYISFLELNQIAKKDISSANLRTQPDYDYQDGKSIKATAL